MEELLILYGLHTAADATDVNLSVRIEHMQTLFVLHMVLRHNFLKMIHVLLLSARFGGHAADNVDLQDYTDEIGEQINTIEKDIQKSYVLAVFIPFRPLGGVS